MHDVLEASIFLLQLPLRCLWNSSAFSNKPCDVAGLLRLLCVIMGGSVGAAQVTRDVIGHTTAAGSEIRALKPMILV